MNVKSEYWTSLHGLATLVLVGAALYFLVVEHGPHVLPYLPYLIILLCPLMHIFMHKSHGGQGHGEQHQQGADEAYRRAGQKAERKLKNADFK